MIIISNVIGDFAQSPSEIIEKARKIAGLAVQDIADSFIMKTSLDVRHQKRPQIVASVGFCCTLDEEKFVLHSQNPNVIFRAPSPALPPIVYGNKPLTHSPIIVGFGPAGMFAGLILAQNGYRPLVIDRGDPIETRVQTVERFWQSGKLDCESNVQFGEGGAGTFSDGKLTTRIHDPRCEFVLKTMARLGAPREILYKSKPHIGTDYLRQVVSAMKAEIIQHGGRVIPRTRLDEVIIKNKMVHAVRVGTETIPCSVLILAIGHSARDTFEMLMKKNVVMQTKPFSVGVRIEHLQQAINTGLYGKYAQHPLLPPGEYQLSLRKNDRAVYTFCMCPGGCVVPSASEQDGIVTNGMSAFARDLPNANSALVVSVSESDFGADPRAAIAFQRRLEHAAFLSGGSNYKAPAQSVGAFFQNHAGLQLGRVFPSYSLGVRACNFRDLFPETISQMLETGLMGFGKKIRGFDAPDAILTGVETRTSSPVRILRDDNGQAIGLSGLFPCGEGAGYAGGIMSAAVDGIQAAYALMHQYAPMK